MTMTFAARFATLALLAASAPASKSEAQLADGLAPPACDYGEPAAGYEAQLADFAFLIGDFSVSAHRWQDEEWSPPRPGTPARWNGEYTLDGKGIRDVWYGRDPGAAPGSPVGVNIRIFDEDRGAWEMMWLHTATKTVQHLRAWRAPDGRLLMEQVYPTGRNFLAEFQVLSDGSWQRIDYQKSDAGAWEPRTLLKATRIPCD